jgi:hypothetical protein
MSLISQPGSDYQLAEVTVDAGNARDIMLMLLDVHAVLDHLYLDGDRPRITAPAEEYLRESASPYTLPSLIGALGDVITVLGCAIDEAVPPSIVDASAAGNDGPADDGAQNQAGLTEPGPGLE